MKTECNYNYTMKKQSESKDFNDYYQSVKSATESVVKVSKQKSKIPKSKKKITQPLQGNTPKNDQQEYLPENQGTSRNIEKIQQP